VLAQALGRIPRKRRPRQHHILHGPILQVRVRYTRHVLRAPHNHVQVAAVVGAGARVEGQVGPLAKVAVAVGGDAGGDPGRDFGSRGAGEAGEVEGGPLGVVKGEIGSEGGELVEAGFVVGVAGEVGLGVG